MPMPVSPARIIKRHARHLYRVNMGLLWLYSFLVAFPGLLWDGVCLLYPRIPAPVPALISFIMLILTTPLALGWMRLLYLLFMSDTSDRLPPNTLGELFYYYRRFLQTWKGVSLFTGVITAASIVSYLLNYVQHTFPIDAAPSWLQAGVIFLSLAFLCAMLFLICRLLTAPYLFFRKEQLPPVHLLRESLTYSAGYFGFILGFVLSMCLLVLIFPVLFGLLAALDIWVSSFSLWTANFLFSVFILPYILLAVAGLSSILMPSEKELAKQNKRKTC